MRPVLAALLSTASLAGGHIPFGGAHRTVDQCTHKSGFAGGFSECSACGISAREGRRQKSEIQHRSSMKEV